MDMDWTQALTIIISIFGLFLVAIPFIIVRMDSHKKDSAQKIDSFQKENNAKFEQVLMRMESNKRDSDQKVEHLEQRIDSKFDAVNTRFNALENRLTSLEAETKSELRHINQRLSNIENCVMPRKVFHFEETHKDDHEEPKEN